MKTLSSLTQRILSLLVLIPLAILAVYFGGWVLTVLVVIIVALAAWEFDSLFRHGSFSPSSVLLIGGVSSLVIARHLGGFAASDTVMVVLILTSLAWHTIAFERGAQNSAMDFCISLCGIVYLGWLSSYVISVRDLPDGLWWSLLTLPAISFADGGAYLIGRAFGKHKMSPVVSPKKTWEGYLGGVVVSIILSTFLAWLWGFQASTILPWHGAVCGFVIGLLAPMGDLGESMLKRQFGMKDSSNLIPGHGGFLDRIDSFLWTGVLGYYLIIWIFMR